MSAAKPVTLTISVPRDVWAGLANRLAIWADHPQCRPDRRAPLRALREQILVEALTLPPAEERRRLRAERLAGLASPPAGRAP